MSVLLYLLWHETTGTLELVNIFLLATFEQIMHTNVIQKILHNGGTNSFRFDTLKDEFKLPLYFTTMLVHEVLYILQYQHIKHDPKAAEFSTVIKSTKVICCIETIYLKNC